jgi:hypothetical protein
MAFGFPAYHTEIYQPKSENINLLDKIKDAIISLGWKIESKNSNQIIGSTSASLMSYGERIKIVIKENGSYSITSKCSFPIQCIDYGKNRKNVIDIISFLSD